MYEQVNK